MVKESGERFPVSSVSLRVKINPTTPTASTLRPFRCLGVDSLHRMIKYDQPEKPEALREWKSRHGHDYPVLCIPRLSGNPIVIE